MACVGTIYETASRCARSWIHEKHLMDVDTPYGAVINQLHESRHAYQCATLRGEAKVVDTVIVKMINSIERDSDGKLIPTPDIRDNEAAYLNDPRELDARAAVLSYYMAIYGKLAHL